ncbi:hypothetical protein [Mesorhizobium sp. M0767]|uniref:ImmA/IrrE family metallo-endopeptidase n=1 Tax=unclassified Mesorhizobium TaxID=325217 RepID=UPI003336A1FE
MDDWTSRGSKVSSLRRAIPGLVAWARFRVPLLIICLSALTWLIMDRSPTERRALAINEALQRGEIGDLTPSETESLQKLLEELLASADVNLPVRLNKPLDDQSEAKRDQIHVFTTSPVVQSISGNGRGNASYDSMLDAIFVDLDIVRPARAVQMYANIRIFDENEEGSYNYFSFVFLHELGHRMLHRDRRPSLDTVLAVGDSIAQKYENEADVFALRGLRAHYKTARSIGRYTGPSNVDGEGFTGALARMVDESNRSLLFSAVPYSPFYSDAAHPTFLSRTLGFLASTSLAEGENANWLKLVKFGLLRIGDIAARPLFEIQVPETISSVSSSKDGIAIVGKNGSSFLVGRNTVEAFNASGTVKAVVAAVATASVEPVSQPADGGGIGTAAQPVELQIGSNLYLPVGASRIVSPGDLPIFARSAALFVEALIKVGIVSDQDAAQGTKKLISALAAAGCPETSGFKLVSVENRWMHALVFDLANGGEKLTGIASIATANLSTLSVDRLDLETWRKETLVGLKFHVVLSPNGVDYYVAGDRWQSRGPEKTGAEICVWKVSEAPPDLVACHPLVAALVPGWRNGDGWPYGEVLLMKTVWFAPDHIVANVQGDSVYAFDLTRRKARVAFHPGGLNIVALPEGDVLFYATGGHKAFVVRPWI